MSTKKDKQTASPINGNTEVREFVQYETWITRLEYWLRILPLAAAVVAAVFAFQSKDVALGNSDKIDEVE